MCWIVTWCLMTVCVATGLYVKETLSSLETLQKENTAATPSWNVWNVLRCQFVLLLGERPVEGATALGRLFFFLTCRISITIYRFLPNGGWYHPTLLLRGKKKGERVVRKTPVLKFHFTFNAGETVRRIEDTACLSYVGTFLENKIYPFKYELWIVDRPC